MAKRKAITAGQRFNNWTILSVVPNDGKRRMVLCRCECGTEKVLDLTSVRIGTSKSCGCLKRLAVYVLPGMKRCSKCKATLPIADFYPRAYRGPDAFGSKCKNCANGARKDARIGVPAEEREAALETARQWKRDNPDRVREQKQAWNKANPEKAAEHSRRNSKQFRAKNPELAKSRVAASMAKKPAEYRAKGAAWAKANPHKCRASFKRYMTRKAQAYPAWANDFFIEEAYELAQHRQQVRALGHKSWHVDHQVPLQSKLVCGLHTHDNLQVIPGVLNVSKGNRHWPDQ